ncbi:MAG: hypothetical protein ACLU5J_01690 [Christensenellales bacterium]
MKKMNLDYDDFEMGPITVNVGIMEISRNRIRVTLDSRFQFVMISIVLIKYLTNYL